MTKLIPTHMRIQLRSAFQLWSQISDRMGHTQYRFHRMVFHVNTIAGRWWFPNTKTLMIGSSPNTLYGPHCFPRVCVPMLSLGYTVKSTCNRHANARAVDDWLRCHQYLKRSSKTESSTLILLDCSLHFSLLGPSSFFQIIVHFHPWPSSLTHETIRHRATAPYTPYECPLCSQLVGTTIQPHFLAV